MSGLLKLFSGAGRHKLAHRSSSSMSDGDMMRLRNVGVDHPEKYLFVDIQDTICDDLQVLRKAQYVESPVRLSRKKSSAWTHEDDVRSDSDMDPHHDDQPVVPESTIDFPEEMSESESEEETAIRPIFKRKSNEVFHNNNMTKRQRTDHEEELVIKPNQETEYYDTDELTDDDEEEASTLWNTLNTKATQILNFIQEPRSTTDAFQHALIDIQDDWTSEEKKVWERPNTCHRLHCKRKPNASDTAYGQMLKKWTSSF